MSKSFPKQKQFQQVQASEQTLIIQTNSYSIQMELQKVSCLECLPTLKHIPESGQF